MRILVSVVGATGLAGMRAPHPLHTAPRGECVPLLSGRDELPVGPTVCYLPTHIAVAERAIWPRPVRPILPSTPLSLPLRQVLVQDASTLSAASAPRAARIIYVFGTPSAGCRPGWHCTAQIPYVTVQESIGHRAVTGIRITQNRTIWPYRWSLDANIPARNLTVHIVSDVGERLVRQIGQRIVQATSTRRGSMLGTSSSEALPQTDDRGGAGRSGASGRPVALLGDGEQGDSLDTFVG